MAEGGPSRKEAVLCCGKGVWEAENDSGADTEEGAPLAQVIEGMDRIDNPVEVVPSQQDGSRHVQAEGVQLCYGVKRELGVHVFTFISVWRAGNIRRIMILA